MADVTREQAAATDGGTTGTDFLSLLLPGIAGRCFAAGHTGTLTQPRSHAAPCIPPGLACKAILIYKKD